MPLAKVQSRERLRTRPRAERAKRKCDETAEGMPDDVRLGDVLGVEDRRGVVGHGPHRDGGAGGPTPPHASVVERQAGYAEASPSIWGRQASPRTPTP